ncbi:MAG: hypothetical protein ACR2NX_03120 [Chthoniobacterales bacterium]
MKINLTYARRLLLRADGTRHRSLKIRGPYADRQVLLMLEAGFLEETLQEGMEKSFVITPSGHAFLATAPMLLALPSCPEPAPDALSIAPSARSATVLQKWRLNFGELDTSHPMGSLRSHTAEPEENA